MKRATFLLVILWAVPALPCLADGPSAAARREGETEGFPRLAISGGKVVTVTRGVVDGGAVLVAGGKIVDVVGPSSDGAEAAIPDGYEVVDARDRWIVPGFVDVHSHVGGSDLNDMVYPTNSGLRVLDNIMPNNPRLRKAQAGGVTVILFLPGSGTNLSGFAALMKTGGDTLEEVLVRYPGALKVAQGGNPERRGGDLGLGSMGMNAILRRELEDGKRYSDAWDAYERGEREHRPPFNPRLESYRKVFRREIPVLVHTQGSLLVAQTLRMFRDELDLWVIVGHGTFNGSELAPEAARKGVWVSNGPRQLRFDGDFGAVVGLARRWHDGGVAELSLNTDAGVVPQEELFYQAAMAVRLGLDEETALRAVTIHGAKALGIDDRVGSIEKGKDADLVVWTGHPLDPSSHVVLTVINGKVVYDTRREPRRF